MHAEGIDDIHSQACFKRRASHVPKALKTIERLHSFPKGIE